MIHLINMPFASVLHPSLALSVMKSQLAAAGVPSKVFDLNVELCARIGLTAYQTISRFSGAQTQPAEWLFAGEAWKESFGPSETEFVQLTCAELAAVDVDVSAEWLISLRREMIPAFLEDAIREMQRSGEVRVVAFTCNFFQTVAALALGRMVKRRLPEVKAVFGGAGFQGDMGRELMKKVEWIDAASIGEADDVIVPLFEVLLDGGRPVALQGVLYRDDRGSVCEGCPPRPVSPEVFRAIPSPDFSDFFTAVSRAGLANDQHWRSQAFLPFESSRGCWWGEKQHCRFCGLDRDTMSYRTKDAGSVLETLCEYVRRYPVRRLQAVDNILSMTYFQSLLPMLRAGPPADDLELFYQVKANLTSAQIKCLVDAKVKYAQPGIESLSSHLLNLLRKGVSALQNVFFLKTARQHGLIVLWNNLIGIPGEKPEDYAQMEDWLPKLHHLQPPFGGAHRLELFRFSPYFFEQGRWVSNVTPLPWYRSLFPEHVVDLSQVAYYFNADWKDTLGEQSYQGVLSATNEWVRRWRDEPELPSLSIDPVADEGCRIHDARSSTPMVWHLDARQAAIYAAIDEPASLSSVVSRLRNSDRIEDASYVAATLEGFVASGLALQEHMTYLALALPTGTPPWPLSDRAGVYPTLEGRASLPEGVGCSPTT